MRPDASTMAEVLRRHRQRGEHPLLICDDQRITYAGAERRSAGLAKGLIALGTGKGTHVGLLYPNGVDFVIGMLAAARIGAVVVPFSTFATASELRTQLANSDTSIMLAAAAYRSHDYVHRINQVLDTDHDEFDPQTTLFNVNAPALRHIVFDADALARLGESVAQPLLTATEADVDPSDTLAIVYTSGSTGPPKGAIHTHASLIGHQSNLNEIRGLSVDDKLFSNSPFFWIGGFAFGLLATLIAGATLVCSNATDAGATLDLIDAEQPNMTNGFAAAIAHLTRHPSFAGRRMTARRGNLYPIMAPEARPADIELRHNMLGMTEAGSVLLLSGDETDQPEHRRGSYGKPAPGFDTKVIDPQNGTPLTVGEVGELCIRGPYVMQGYYGRSREECFDADGWFHTGDLVRTDDDGFCYFVTRAGSMIKTAGANVTPAEVERALLNVLADIGGDVAVYVLGLPDAIRGQVVAAVIALEDHDFDAAHINEAEVRHKLKAELSAYKVPKAIVTCRRAAIPLLSSGKVDLTGLAKLFDA
jgi:acyl-CoA synthetase (AMP-forming)/AMP-acid ligase II